MKTDHIADHLGRAVMRHHFTRVAAVAFSSALANSCALGAFSSMPIATPPRVYFVSPREGDRLARDIEVQMGADGLTIEPASRGVGPLRAHFHLLVDRGCAPAGQRLAERTDVYDFAEGGEDVALSLSPGEHELCLQAGDGAHVALPYAELIHVRVGDDA